MSNASPFRTTAIAVSLLGVFFPVIKEGMGWVVYPFLLLCLGGLFLSWKMPVNGIEVNDSCIRLMRRGSSGIRLIDRYFVEPEIVLDWDRIRSVTTKKIRDTVVTYISPYDEPKPFFERLVVDPDSIRRNEFGIAIANAFYRDYISILRIVKHRAPQAHFDELSESIIQDGYVRRTGHLFMWLAILIVIILALYILVNTIR